MDVFFLCLANSYKRGGRCIAGVELTHAENGQWKIVRNSDGSPHWIRPVDETTANGEIPNLLASDIPLFSVVKLSGVHSCPHFAHSEDTYYYLMERVDAITPSPNLLEELEDNVHKEVFFTKDRTLSVADYQAGNYSLMLIKPERTELVTEEIDGVVKYRMRVLYGRTTYLLPVTDPVYREFIEHHPDVIGKTVDAFLTLSIGLEFEGEHHKLVAAVVTSQIPFLKDSVNLSATGWVIKDVRQFTEKERAEIEKAYIVSTQQGHSVYIKRKDRSDCFIPLEDDKQGNDWAKVNMKTAQLVVYGRDHEPDVVRVRIPVTEKRTLGEMLKRLLRF